MNYIEPTIVSEAAKDLSKGPNFSLLFFTGNVLLLSKSFLFVEEDF